MSGHVLIIEDEILIALELECLLADLGFATFDIADSPNEARVRAEAHRPDLITADYRIIGGTGIDAVTEITAAIGPIPVIYITSNTDMVAGEGRPVVEKPIGLRPLASACHQICPTA
jgi:CheY-like chemotaxis protein